jgi:hypothetical protein
MATLYALVIGRHAVLIPDSLRASVSEVSLAVADFAASHLIDALTAALLGLFFVWWFIITFRWPLFRAHILQCSFFYGRGKSFFQTLFDRESDLIVDPE